MRLCILSGGNSYEREVSISSAKEIYKNLDKSKYNIEIIEIPKDGSLKWIEKLLFSPPDLVLIALHGGMGEGGQVQGLLECMNIPYIGSGVLSSALCLNKYMSKMIMRHSRIPVLDDVLIKNERDFIIYEDIINDMGYPLVVKPNLGGSSVCISIVKNQTELRAAAEKIFKLDDFALVEKYIKGNEVTCGILETPEGLSILPVLDIKTDRGFYDYDAKYVDDGTVISFSSLPEFQKSMICEISKKVFKILNCKGYGRVDMIVYQEQIIVLEMNTLPGLTSHSLIPKAASTENNSFSDFLDHIISYVKGISATEF